MARLYPFLEILCHPPGLSRPIKLYRSEVIKKNLNPEFRPFELETAAVGGFDTVFTVNCYDWDKDGSHDLIGSFETTLRDFSFGPMQVALVNPAKLGRYDTNSTILSLLVIFFATDLGIAVLEHFMWISLFRLLENQRLPPVLHTKSVYSELDWTAKIYLENQVPKYTM